MTSRGILSLLCLVVAAPLLQGCAYAGLQVIEAAYKYADRKKGKGSVCNRKIEGDLQCDRRACERRGFRHSGEKSTNRRAGNFFIEKTTPNGRGTATYHNLIYDPDRKEHVCVKEVTRGVWELEPGSSYRSFLIGGTSNFHLSAERDYGYKIMRKALCKKDPTGKSEDWWVMRDCKEVSPVNLVWEWVGDRAKGVVFDRTGRLVHQGYYRTGRDRQPRRGISRTLSTLVGYEEQQWLPWETVYDRQKTVLQEYLDAARYPSTKPVLPAPAIKMTAPTASSSTDSSSSKQSFADMDRAQEKCKEIGLTPKTPDFAKCVMRLMD